MKIEFKFEIGNKNMREWMSIAVPILAFQALLALILSLLYIWNLQ